MGRKAIAVCLSVVLMPLSLTASAQEVPRPKGSEECLGGFYRPKSEGVPVYDTPTTTGRVLAKLPLGVSTCSVGEMGEFVILEWPLRGPYGPVALGVEGGTEETPGEGNTRKVAFARSVELWEPVLPHRPARGGGIVDFMKRFYYRLQSGVVPEDVLAPYRPLTNAFGNPSEGMDDSEKSCGE